MRAVYIMQEGASLRREGGLLHVVSGRRKVAEVSVHGLEQLVLMGNIVVTPSALDLLLERGVDTVFLTLHGRYRGRVVRGLSGSVRLRMAQYRKLSDVGEVVAVARSVVLGKVGNMRTFLGRFIRRHGEVPELRQAMRAMAAAMEHVRLAVTLDQIRGCEGAATASYFRVFGRLLRADGFYFESRNRRPPMDPVNALLSFGYTLLANAVEAAVNIVGLDPYVGSLHAIESGRPSLVCDLVEEFRAPVVDALVVAAINRGVIHPDDFEDSGPEEPVLMKREAIGSFVRAFERRLDSSIFYSPEGRRLSLRKVIEMQVRRFARYVLGEEGVYEPFFVR